MQFLRKWAQLPHYISEYCDLKHLQMSLILPLLGPKIISLVTSMTWPSDPDMTTQLFYMIPDRLPRSYLICTQIAGHIAVTKLGFLIKKCILNYALWHHNYYITLYTYTHTRTKTPHYKISFYHIQLPRGHYKLAEIFPPFDPWTPGAPTRFTPP